jgi:DNA processing protein
MITKNELLHAMALQRVPNLGDTSAKKLIQAVGSAEGVFKEKKERLIKIEGIQAFRLRDLMLDQYLSEAAFELRIVESNQWEYRYFLDQNYPEKLKHCWDGPILYFQKGNIDLQGKLILSIVGTRKATSYGISFCEQLLESLQFLKPVIVSGFAYGIDITAQRKAMDLGLQTIGCLAHGLNQIYPKIHKRFVPDLLSNGGLISEFWSDDTFNRKNFLKRNRIIAGLSDATIVIESAEKGGSLVTADIANSYNREVFAVPGRSNDPLSYGCNYLIKTQQAHMLTGVEDLIYMMGWESNIKKPKQARLFVELTEEEKIVEVFLKEKDKEDLDTIAINCGLPTFKIASILLNLELKGLVQPLPGKMFQWIQ